MSDVVVKGLRLTPFNYYIGMMTDIMTAEKRYFLTRHCIKGWKDLEESNDNLFAAPSYDALPNFTAADCLRLLGIGRNQYIDLMNQCRYLRNWNSSEISECRRYEGCTATGENVFIKVLCLPLDLVVVCSDLNLFEIYCRWSRLIQWKSIHGGWCR